MTAIQFHTMADGRRIAFRRAAGAGPALVFLPGYMSDMAGGKAQAVFDWAVAHGRAALLLDYSGCGESAGDFAQGTLSRWREEVLALIAGHVPERVILIGSSMGGWLMLLCAQALGREKLAGLIGIAAAPDFTEWGFTAEQKAALQRDGRLAEPNLYGPEPSVFTHAFWESGQQLRLLEAEIAIDCPVRLLHGEVDAEVPLEIALRLMRALRSSDVQLNVLKGGGHRLSEPHEIRAILHAVEALLEP